MSDQVHQDDSGNDRPVDDDAANVTDGDKWIWGVWIVIALISVAILPFASRFKEVAVAIASFCGVTFS